MDTSICMEEWIETNGFKEKVENMWTIEANQIHFVFTKKAPRKCTKLQQMKIKLIKNEYTY